LHQVARVLDYNAPTNVRYTVTTIRGQNSTQADRIAMRENLKRSIKAGVPAAVNIAATPDEQPPLQRAKTGGRFTLRHHMPVVGYNENNNTVLVQDPWTKPFWVSVYQLADMTGTRGYVSLK
ncbi:MAG TPA: C39 family peptidase, partial [Citricoccus sp.]